ncbi:MAG: hypothetical protein AAFX06_22980 [Planctomycetota bacterium]
MEKPLQNLPSSILSTTNLDRLFHGVRFTTEATRLLDYSPEPKITKEGKLLVRGGAFEQKVLSESTQKIQVPALAGRKLSLSLPLGPRIAPMKAKFVLASRLSFVALVCLVFSTGCGSLPSMSSADLLSPGLLKRKSKPQMVFANGTPTPLMPDGMESMTMEAYQRVRQAKAQNSIVLQVQDDSSPIRVLPLPSDEQSPGMPKSAFVSELLTQTGLTKRLGSSLRATLYRPAPDSIQGIRMVVSFREDGTIDPSTDYALQPGDRLHVTKRQSTGLSSLTDLILQR